MSFDTFATACKIVSLLMFFPIFVGVVFYAYGRRNKTRLESYALIPLQED
ncbi:cbb3-type cytochrome c oxidase subunit 3 [bacterium]|nr:cbb3-type cytochrome c oxidase subunit 3 [bacterium]